MACPICLGGDVYASHRRGALERGPLTWIGLLPFRCGQCQTRFYRFALKDARRRRKSGESGLAAELRRAPRWPTSMKAAVTIDTAGKGSVTLEGVVENVSLNGVRLRLPEAVPAGSLVRVTLEGAGSRLGEIRWVRSEGDVGVLHGVQFQTRLDHRGPHARPLRWIRLRRLGRRSMIALIGLALIATFAYGLVWWIQDQQKYAPRYYEPKDVERQIHDLQRDLQDVNPPAKR